MVGDITSENMASKWKCMRPECPYETEEMDAATGIEYLKLHSSQVHGVAKGTVQNKKYHNLWKKSKRGGGQPDLEIILAFLAS